MGHQRKGGHGRPLVVSPIPLVVVHGDHWHAVGLTDHNVHRRAVMVRRERAGDLHQRLADLFVGFHQPPQKDFYLRLVAGPAHFFPQGGVFAAAAEVAGVVVGAAAAPLADLYAFTSFCVPYCSDSLIVTFTETERPTS